MDFSLATMDVMKSQAGGLPVGHIIIFHRSKGISFVSFLQIFLQMAPKTIWQSGILDALDLIRIRESMVCILTTYHSEYDSSF